jgi:hypothetical protein
MKIWTHRDDGYRCLKHEKRLISLNTLCNRHFGALRAHRQLQPDALGYTLASPA